MARQLVLFFALSLCVLPSLVSARLVGRPFHIKGRVYCDTCRCGFETKKTTYIPGARVRIECEDRTTLRLKYSVEGETDETGTYNILVEDDHQDQICYAALVSSPWPSCNTADPGRSRAHVVVTRNNGAISDLHFANSMGFLRNQAMSGCTELVKQLLQSDE
ncbi:protein DOWNSTREAM OF FLC [Ricinus communis]|uniref:Pollen-specific protein C13, putative n=1 Tax=Ricinus communis TaxID=3988 RepID=B9T4H0_RICCO|nr:protein DOWNSTREAM OF FLC [Ricinus communis]EEF29251.1 Pollen-specific protein C13 precursor, putative [Ricinus communis]|eukprot:XP_002533139.1 protein DOWNSTREAM OF FLC [Ricinus communis]